PTARKAARHDRRAPAKGQDRAVAARLCRARPLLHLEVGVLDVLVAGRLAALAGAGRGARLRARGAAATTGVELLAQLVHRLLEVGDRLLDPLGVLALAGLAQGADLALDLALLRRVELAAQLLQLLLGLVGHSVGLVLQVDHLAALLVLAGEAL